MDRTHPTATRFIRSLDPPTRPPAPRDCLTSQAPSPTQISVWLVDHLLPSTPLEHWLIASFEQSLTADSPLTPSLLDLLRAFEKLRILSRSSCGGSPALANTHPHLDCCDDHAIPGESTVPRRGVRLMEREAIEPEDTFTDAPAPTDVSHLWQDRLQLLPEVSATSPVVLGTAITVRRVVSLVVDGHSWTEIKRLHPELTDADIRACLAYCVEEEGGCVPLD